MADEITYEWTNNIEFTSGLTPDGSYDNDTDYQRDIVKATKYFGFQLGFPMVNIELHYTQVFANFENAVEQYTSIVNEYNIIDNMTNIIGTNKSTDYTSKYIKGTNLGNLFSYSDSYATDFGVGGNITFHKFKVPIIAEQQEYDLKQLIENNSELWTQEEIDNGGVAIEVKKVFHFSPAEGVKPYMMSSLAYSNYENINAVESLDGGYSQNSIRRFMMPLGTTLQASQSFEQFNRVFLSNYSFNIKNNVLEIFPIPTSDGDVWLEYIVSRDRNSTLIDDNASDKVSDISNAGYNLITYSTINQPGRLWIKNYTVALSKMVLGEIRSKYSDVPVPDASISLNGDALKSEGQTEIETLETSLRETLEKLSTESRMERQKNIDENINAQLENLPFPIMLG